MRLNKFVAQATGLSRRAADDLIQNGHAMVNDSVGNLGQSVRPDKDSITLNGVKLSLPSEKTTIMLNKPVGYVCSRDGQGSKTIYDLLPKQFHHLKPVGRLDKDSSGLLLLTSDGQLAHKLTHPSFQKEKMYEIELDKPLTPEDKALIEHGIKIDDYISRLRLAKNGNCKMEIENCSWIVSMSMGRNRQIRRTFAALGYNVTKLHRTHFGPHSLNEQKLGTYVQI